MRRGGTPASRSSLPARGRRLCPPPSFSNQPGLLSKSELTEADSFSTSTAAMLLFREATILSNRCLEDSFRFLFGLLLRFTGAPFLGGIRSAALRAC